MLPINKPKDGYFLHYNNLRNTSLIKRIRHYYGLKGYAMFLMLIELLDSNDGRVKWDDISIEDIKKEFNTADYRVANVIDLLLNEKVLLLQNGYLVLNTHKIVETPGGGDSHTTGNWQGEFNLIGANEIDLQSGFFAKKIPLRGGFMPTETESKQIDLQEVIEKEKEEQERKKKKKIPPTPPYKEKEINKEKEEKEREVLCTSALCEKTSFSPNHAKNNINLNQDMEEEKKESCAKEKKEETEQVDYKGVMDLWNSICKSFPKVQALSTARKTKIKLRLQEMGQTRAEQMEVLKRLFEKMQLSNFLKGDNRHQWRACFDWFFTNDKNWLKVLEGNYDNRELTNNKNSYGNNITKYNTQRGRFESQATRPEDYETTF